MTHILIDLKKFVPSLDVAECIDSLCEWCRAAGAEFVDICALDELFDAIDCIDVSIVADCICVVGLISIIFLRTSLQNDAGNGVR